MGAHYLLACSHFHFWVPTFKSKGQFLFLFPLNINHNLLLLFYPAQPQASPGMLPTSQNPSLPPPPQKSTNAITATPPQGPPPQGSSPTAPSPCAGKDVTSGESDGTANNVEDISCEATLAKLRDVLAQCQDKLQVREYVLEV